MSLCCVESSISGSAKFARENVELKRAKEELERQMKSVRAEKEMIELQLRERAERQQATLNRAERERKQSQPSQRGDPTNALPLALSQPISQGRRTAPVAPAPSASSPPPESSAPMDVSEEVGTAAPAQAAAEPVVVDVISPPWTSLIPFPPSEGQSVIEHLLLPSSDGGGSLWTFLKALNSFLALQPPSSSLVASLTGRVTEVECLITAVQEDKKSPPAFLSPCCHLLKSLCDISTAFEGLTSLIPRPSPAAPSAASPVQGQRLHATDDIIVQLLHVFLILLTASPSCRTAAMKAPPSLPPSTLMVPASHRPHPLAKLLDNPYLFVRTAPNKGRRPRDGEDQMTVVSEEKEERRVGDGADVDRSAFPDLLPLLLGLIHRCQRPGAQQQADRFLQPTLRLLLLLVESSPASLPSFLPLLSDGHLFPLLRLNSPPAIRCLAVRMFSLCLEEPSTLHWLPHPLPPTSFLPNGATPPTLSLLHSLYSSMLEVEDDPPSQIKPSPASRQREKEKVQSASLIAWDKGSRERKSDDREVESRLWLRLHIIRLLAFVVGRYGDEGIRWLVNERPDPLIAPITATSALGGDETKEQLQHSVVDVEAEGVDVAPDKYPLVDLLVQLLTAEMALIQPFHRLEGIPTSLSQTALDSLLLRERRVASRPQAHLLSASQPMASSARVGWQSTLRMLRIQVVVEGFRVLSHLLFSSIPSPSPARLPPLSLPSQLSTCVHALLQLLTSLATCRDASIASLSQEVASLRAVLISKGTLDTVELDTEG